MADVGLLDYLRNDIDQNETVSVPWDKAYDIAKIFNENPCSR